jgi:hypothetical protein
MRSGNQRICHACGEIGHIRANCPQSLKPAQDAPAHAQEYKEERKAAWRPYCGSDAGRRAAVDSRNQQDLEKLVNTIPDEGMRDVLLKACAEVAADPTGRVVKEIYLPIGRCAELVTSGALGGLTQIQSSDLPMSADHLDGFTALFDPLPAKMRRTGISATLVRATWPVYTALHSTASRISEHIAMVQHRISRTVNPVTGNITSVAARVGRVIEGHVKPLCVLRITL